MKKLVFAMGIILIIASCKQSKDSKQKHEDKPKEKAVSVLSKCTGWTLNGLTCDQANKMVYDFRKDTMSSDDVTAIWLDKTWVDKIADLLTAEQASVGTDGFRIYFAKRADGKNTIVIVSTKRGKADPEADTGVDHDDYFEHNSDYLSNNQVVEKEEYKVDPGALLYQDPNCTSNCFPGSIDYVDCDYAKEIVKNFKKEIINTHSEWFPIELIQDLQVELDAASKTNDVGIRIYFARNTAVSQIVSHRGRHTFVISTTKLYKSINTDYFDCYSSKLRNIKHHQKDGKKGSFDNGEQCPANCTGPVLPMP